jgi:hypothetical protein
MQASLQASLASLGVDGSLAAARLLVARFGYDRACFLTGADCAAVQDHFGLTSRNAASKSASR